VFDPLAVVLLLASQYSFQWFRQQDEEQKNELVQETLPPEDLGKDESTEQPVDTAVEERDLAEEANQQIADIEREVDVEAAIASAKEVNRQEEKSALDEWNSMIAEAEKAAEEESTNDDNAIINNAEDREKVAMRLWKAAYPDDNLKHQRKLFDSGIILELPWMVPPYMTSDVTADNVNETVDAEPISSTSLKLSDLKKKSATYIEKIGKNQVAKPINDQ
jgi:hypothetical protein